jgi:hypothetical protein
MTAAEERKPHPSTAAATYHEAEPHPSAPGGARPPAPASRPPESPSDEPGDTDPTQPVRPSGAVGRTPSGAISGVRTTEQAAAEAKTKTPAPEGVTGGVFAPPWHEALPATPKGGPPAPAAVARGRAMLEHLEIPRARVQGQLRLHGMVERDRIASVQSAVDQLRAALADTGLECHGGVSAEPI